MENERIITHKRDGDVTMLRGGACWVKITKIKRGQYAVAYGWKGEFSAIPGRTQHVSSYCHALIAGKNWIEYYGW